MPDYENAHIAIPDDPRTDEQLVNAIIAGDNPAFDTLFKRYFDYLEGFLKKKSDYKDKQFLDDVREITFVRIYNQIKEGKFVPHGPGTFKSYLFETALKVCQTEKRKTTGHEVPSSDVFADDKKFYDISNSDLLPDVKNEQMINRLLDEVGEKLTYKELKLAVWKLVNKMPYKLISEQPDFAGHTPAYLMRMMHIIREKLKK